jgi:hypothetical protein
MRIATLTAIAVMGLAVSAASMAQTQSPTPASAPPSSFPAWAYPWVPDFKVAPADDVPQHVPDSAASFTIKQERDLFFVPDWHPEDHPTMPDVVANGRMPDVRATAPPAPADRKTPASPVCRKPTSCSRSRITKAAHGNLQVPNAARAS